MSTIERLHRRIARLDSRTQAIGAEIRSAVSLEKDTGYVQNLLAGRDGIARIRIRTMDRLRESLGNPEYCYKGIDKVCYCRDCAGNLSPFPE